MEKRKIINFSLSHLLVMIGLLTLISCSSKQIPSKSEPECIDTQASQRETHSIYTSKTDGEYTPQRKADSYCMNMATPQQNVVIQVFFATDRNLIESKQNRQSFGYERAPISYGICKVSIPA